MHISRWFQLYNSDLFMEEYLREHVRPTVLMVSLENGNKEDDSRYFSAYTKSQIVSPDNFDGAARMWRESFNMTGSCVDITVLHLEDNVFGVDELKNAVQMIEDDNYKVVAVLIDSLDLMAANQEDRYADERIKLSGISKSIHKFIKDRPFPIISVTQTNREGDKTISDKRSSGMTNIAKSLSRSFVGGSSDIDRRVDWSAFIYLERSPYNKKLYFELKREKMRYQRTDLEYFCHELINGFFFEDDLFLPEGEYGSLLDINPSDDELFLNASNIGSRGITNIKQAPTPRRPDETKVIEIKIDKQVAEAAAVLTGFHWVYETGLRQLPGYLLDNDTESIVEVSPYTKYDSDGWPSIGGK
jgi:hypothetical protein